MVHFEEITPESSSSADEVSSVSQLFQDDYKDIERLLPLLERPTARTRVEELLQKIQKEANVLQRVEQSHTKAAASATNPTAVPMEIDSGSTNTMKPMPPTASSSSSSSVVGTSLKYTSIENFSFDLGGYNSPTITIYVNIPNVGSAPRENITCHFTSNAFDLIVLNHPTQGHNYRLLNTNLDKDIDIPNCKYIVKANKIIIKLQKKKGEYGSYDHWSDLNSKKAKKTSAGSGGKENEKDKDPASSIMDLMKEMYDSGDDNMKKIIGETMLKQREGKLGKDNKFGMDDDDFKM